MIKLLLLVLFVWLAVHAIGFSFKLAWGITKVVGVLLLILALPALLACMLFASGLVLLVPIVLVGAACGVLKR